MKRENDMRVLMIAANDLESSESLGVTKKLKGEYKAFQNLGIDTYFLTFCNDACVVLHGDDKKIVFPKQMNGYVGNIKMYDSAYQICKDYKIDLCYIRYAFADWAVLRMVKRLHKIAKVCMEIPTYPYDKEAERYTNPVARLNYIQDKRNRNRLHRYVNRIATFSDDKEIYGIPCININNGIDVESVKYVGDDLAYDNDVTLISVAVMRPIHGYDRVLSGMAKYYQNNENPERIVRYLIVGNGPDTDHLEQMVHDLNLEPYVEFCGRQSGQALDDLFRRSNLGLAVLAGHREGHDSVSDLKSREYCARGIPFITANEDRAIPDDSIFMKKVPMNEEPLDIDEIIQFFDFIKEHNEIHPLCRQYAEENFGWEAQMKRVLDE